MFIHYTGFTLTPNSCSEGEFIYYLSTESSFFYEMMAEYWTSIVIPSKRVIQPFTAYLMGDVQYYSEISELELPFYPLSYGLLPYIKIKYPENPLIFILYDKILSNRS